MNRNNRFTYTSGSARIESPLHRLGSYSLDFIRLILAAVFLFSGFVKAIDPLGSTYKIEDYLTAFGGIWEKMSVVALPAAVALSTLELVLGFCFLLKIRLRLTAWVALLLMGVMLPLTLYVAIFNPVTDCGCFGDALVISNWATFFKNVVIVLFIIVLLIFATKQRPLFIARVEWGLVVLFIALAVGISVYSYRHLPMLDFRPYKVGVNIPEAMTIPAGKPLDKYETTFIYQKNGEKREFTLADYPKNDSTWRFVEQKTVLIEKGYEAPIHNFNIVDASQNDITDSLLRRQGTVNLLIMYDVNKAPTKAVLAAQKRYERATANGEPFYALTASPAADIARLRAETGITFPFCTSDPITLKTIIRANPGLMTINNGTITGKWNWRDF